MRCECLNPVLAQCGRLLHRICTNALVIVAACVKWLPSLCDECGFHSLNAPLPIFSLHLLHFELPLLALHTLQWPWLSLPLSLSSLEPSYAFRNESILPFLSPCILLSTHPPHPSITPCHFRFQCRGKASAYQILGRQSGHRHCLLEYMYCRFPGKILTHAK